MTLDEDFVKKKLRQLKERHPEIDVDAIERELYPMSGEGVHPVLVKKKKEDDE